MSDKEALEYALGCVNQISDDDDPAVLPFSARARAILQRLIDNPEVLS